MPIMKKIKKGNYNDTMALTDIKTLGELKSSGYTVKTVKDELRDNLIEKIRKKESIFKGILGYEQTVIPQLERAILSRHSINLLGLRGQAKTRIARQLVTLLDEYVPVIAGSELNDDPLAPVSQFGIKLVEEMGDQTPVIWWHRNDRYTEKLATPDVTVADLIGDVDPIKAANQKLSYADERAIHFGLVPRSNRGIFVINELPDLQARIQVSLFNVLQESDIQIRGFKLRLNMDIQFVFTANPEDYTNRGAIITPLKDRIQSQILTHYPQSIELGRQITEQEARLKPEQRERVIVPELLKLLIEQIAVEARSSEYIDAKSGVSARLTITALESLVSSVERRILINDEKQGVARIADLFQVIPAINGKIELVYEGEQEGAENVAMRLVSKAIRTLSQQYFPGIQKSKDKRKSEVYSSIITFFGEHRLELVNNDTDREYQKNLTGVEGLDKAVVAVLGKLAPTDKWVMMEFLLHGLAENSMIGIQQLEEMVNFSDVLGNYLNFGSN